VNRVTIAGQNQFRRIQVPPDKKEEESGTVIAVDLGATNFRVGIVTSTGQIEALRIAEIPRNPAHAGIITDRIISTIHMLLADQTPENFAGIGIGAAGPVDKSHSAILHPPNIPLDILPLTGPVAAEFGLPVHLVNDCSAGLLGEAYFGDGMGAKNFVYVTISTGIGAGIIANGHIVSGRDGNAGEIGHLFVDSEYNLACGCGGRGHWEGYASGRFLPRFYREWQKKNGIQPGPWPAHTARDIFTAIRDNQDPDGNAFIRVLGKINARGISDLIVAYDPDIIVLDGSVVQKNPDLIIPPIEERADRYLPMPRLVVSSHKGLSPLLGASVIARGFDTRFGRLE
jgi:glucokinase